MIFLDFAAYYISGGALNGILEARAAQSPALFFSKKGLCCVQLFLLVNKAGGLRGL